MSSTAARRVAQLNAHLTDAPVDQIQRFPTAAVRSRPDPRAPPCVATTPDDPKARASKRQHCRVSMPPHTLTIQPHRTNTT